MGENRVIETADLPGDSWQYSLRPHYFREYIGQTKAKENLEIFIKAAKLRKEALDTSSCTDRLAWARRPWPASWPMNWASICASRRDRLSSAPAIWRPY